MTYRLNWGFIESTTTALMLEVLTGEVVAGYILIGATKYQGAALWGGVVIALVLDWFTIRFIEYRFLLGIKPLPLLVKVS